MHKNHVLSFDDLRNYSRKIYVFMINDSACL